MQRFVVLNAPSRFPAHVQAAIMSDQKHDVYHCMASTREMKSLDNDMLMEACENLKHSWH